MRNFIAVFVSLTLGISSSSALYSTYDSLIISLMASAFNLVDYRGAG